MTYPTVNGRDTIAHTCLFPVHNRIRHRKRKMQSDWSRLVQGAGTTRCIALYQTLSLPLPRCKSLAAHTTLTPGLCLPDTEVRYLPHTHYTIIPSRFFLEKFEYRKETHHLDDDVYSLETWNFIMSTLFLSIYCYFLNKSSDTR